MCFLSLFRFEGVSPYGYGKQENHLPPELLLHFYRPNKRSSLTKTKDTLRKLNSSPLKNGYLGDICLLSSGHFVGAYFSGASLSLAISGNGSKKISEIVPSLPDIDSDSTTGNTTRRLKGPQWLCCNESAPSGCHPFGFGYVGMQPAGNFWGVEKHRLLLRWLFCCWGRF